jgi:multiple sugar transport system ATP-binding protein
MAQVSFQSIRKTFGGFVAVDDVDLTVGDGEFVVLLGPSGCGKTTLLRCLAGLERVDSGRILIGERDATDLPPRRRRISMVFQSYAVFPHLKVRDNIAFGLRMHKETRTVIAERVESVARMLDITPLLDRYPAQISGGQRQRVAVARALAVRSDVLLMDEPLSNLDALLRMNMRAELKALLNELGATTIYVTHDQTEALSMGDRIAVMNAGHIVQVDTPLAVYANPADTFVGGFVGTPPMNFLDATVTAGADGGYCAHVGSATFDLTSGDAGDLVGRPLALGIRAEGITVETSPGPGTITGTVVVNEPLGSFNLFTVQTEAGMIKVSVANDFFADPGREVALRFRGEHIRWLDRESGKAITPQQPAADPHSPSLVA